MICKCLEVRRRFNETKEMYQRALRRPYSFGVPQSWYNRKLRYMKRLKKIINGRNPFEPVQVETFIGKRYR